MCWTMKPVVPEVANKVKAPGRRIAKERKMDKERRIAKERKMDKERRIAEEKGIAKERS